MTTTELVKSDTPPAPLVVSSVPATLIPTSDELNRMLTFAKHIINAKGLIPDNIDTPGKALAIMETGRELGLYPMTAFRHLYVVNGKVDIETRAMMGIVKARRPDIQISVPEYTSTAVTVRVDRPGQEPIEVRYTLEDAKASGQWDDKKANSPWVRYTRDMLYAAAGKRAMRIACPDLINAIQAHLDEGAQMAAVMEAQAIVPQAIEGTYTALPNEELHNEGDDPDAPMPVEVQTPDPGNPHADLGDLINRLLQLPEDTRKPIMENLKEAFPVMFPTEGRILVSALDEATAAVVAGGLKQVIEEHEPKPAVVE